MTRTKIWKVLAIGLGAAAIVGGAAIAHEHGHWQGRWKEHVGERVDKALDVAQATQPQRTAIHAALDHVFATAEAEHSPADFERAIALFESDRVDPQAIAELRGKHEAAMQKMGDAIVQAVTDAHDALTAPQRKAIVEWARAHKPEHLGQHGRGAQFMKHMVSSRIDEALDQAKVTVEQRAKIHEARDRVFAALEQAHQDPSARIEQALTLFEADQLDQQKIAELRAQHMAEGKRVGDTISQALVEAHDVLTPAQRKSIVEFARAHHQEHARQAGTAD